ncbi:MAG TPA: RDD family protein [Steroidobacteraceae bacterium]|nr:RDD family protein [Steroidobacteraceae bacterium]
MSAAPGGPAATREPEYVGFWARVAAALLDTVWVTLLLLPLLALVGGPGYFTLEHALSATPSLRENLVSYGIPAVVVIAFWRRTLATPGKMAIGAQIVDADTFGKPGFGQLLVRYLGYYVSTIPLGLGLIWVAFDPRKQGWHDKLANTVVIRIRR